VGREYYPRLQTLAAESSVVARPSAKRGSALLVTGDQQRLCFFEVADGRERHLQVSGTEMANLPNITGEALLKIDAHGVNLAVERFQALGCSTWPAMAWRVGRFLGSSSFFLLWFALLRLSFDEIVDCCNRDEPT
jgi:hypothetical protein